MTYEDILQFWFGTLDDNGLASAEYRQRWWKKNPDFDAEIREQFLETYNWLRSTEAKEWRQNPRSALAAIIVLDQFSRNMFRNTSRMFEGDELAQSIANDCLNAGMDQALPTDQKVFMIMPLMHSGTLSHQERCVGYLEDECEKLEGPAKEKLLSNVDYALQHHNIVKHFGRFPHRNAILSRESTEEEKQFLTKPGSSF